MEVRDVFLRQKFSNWKRSVSWRVIVLRQPVVCNVPSESLDPFSKSFQDIFVEGVINCLSWRYKFFVHNAMAVKKTIIMVFTLDLLMRAFFGRGELFVCHSSLCRLVSGSKSNTHYSSPVITLCKKLAQFRFFPANPDKFPVGSLFAPQTIFSAPILHKFFACANVLLEFYEPHFYSSPFLLKSSGHSIGGLSPSQLSRLDILIICRLDWSSRTRVVFNIL